MSEANEAKGFMNLYLKILDRNLQRLTKDIGDLTQKQSLIACVPGGSNANWLVGHLIHYRCEILRASGNDAPWGPEMSTRYGYDSTAAQGDQAESFKGLLEILQSTQALVEQALKGLTESDIDKTLSEDDGHRLEFLVYHETYHTGQAIQYRRVADNALENH